ncbi:MAG: P-II family nitrogen regulator [Smithella sp.]
MKLIIAIVQPEKLTDVKQALSDAKVGKMTVSNVIGCGSQGGYTESYRGATTEVNLLDKVRFEIAVNDDFVKPAVDAIIKGARSGKIGDGKIFVLPMEECIRVRTGEVGSVAVG